ncbi:MAG: hypothetical protein V3V76_08470 [Candidatus Adiutricales bacterium]
MEPITNKDLEEALEKQEKRIEKYFDAKLAPVVKTLEAHQKALYGVTGSNGLVGLVKVLKWGYGLGALALGALMTKGFIL